MILNFKTKKQTTDASAKVVDGKLVLSLPDAVSPVVWQMDLAKAKASALEVLHDEKSDEFMLGLKTPKGEKIDVARFDDRTKAVEGLMAASQALENAAGQIRPSSEIPATQAANDAPVNKKTKTKAKPARSKEETRKRWMIGILAMVMLFIMFTVWSSVLPRIIHTNGANAPVTPTASSSGDPTQSSGVPVSADDFLRAQ